MSSTGEKKKFTVTIKRDKVEPPEEDKKENLAAKNRSAEAKADQPPQNDQDLSNPAGIY